MRPKGFLFVPDYQTKILKAYQLNAKKPRLVSTLSIANLFPSSVFHNQKFVFEAVGSRNIMAIASGHHLKLINIFTKKVLYEADEHNGSIFSLNYLKEMNLLAVGISPNIVKIYSITEGRVCLHLEHDLKLGQKDGEYIIIIHDV